MSDATGTAASETADLEAVAETVIGWVKKYTVMAFWNNFGRGPIEGDEPIFHALMKVMGESAAEHLTDTNDPDETQALLIFLARQRPGSPAAMARN